MKRTRGALYMLPRIGVTSVPRSCGEAGDHPHGSRLAFMADIELLANDSHDSLRKRDGMDHQLFKLRCRPSPTLNRAVRLLDFFRSLQVIHQDVPYRGGDLTRHDQDLRP